MATTVVSPSSFGQSQSDLGQDFLFAQLAIQEQLVEKVEVLGLLPLMGELQGSGTDTVRITEFGGVGHDEQLQAMSTETEAITPSGFNTAYTEASIARYGLEKSETYQQSILGRPGGVSLDLLVSKVPETFHNTIKNLMLTAGAGITGVVGTAGTAWTMDDEINLVRTLNETDGFAGMADAWRHPEQFSDLAASLRNEPANQTPEVMSAILGLKAGGGAFNFLGISNRASSAVNASGADHIGFVTAPGAIGWVRASTLPLAGRVDDPSRAMFIPEIGGVIEWTGTPGTAQAKYTFNGWFGVKLLPSTLFPQLRIRSVND